MHDGARICSNPCSADCRDVPQMDPQLFQEGNLFAGLSKGMKPMLSRWLLEPFQIRATCSPFSPGINGLQSLLSKRLSDIEAHDLDRGDSLGFKCAAGDAS